MKRKLRILASICALAFCFATLAGCDDEPEKTGAAPVSAAVKQAFPAFAAKDINGQPVTNDIFAPKKLTVVNVWGTFCPPCIGEMPELGEWSRQMPDDVQIIGLVCDIEDENDKRHIKAAKEIIGKAKVDFVNVIPDSSLQAFLSQVEAVPTTFFVNSQGQIVGEPIVGADVDGYKDFVEEYVK